MGVIGFAPTFPLAWTDGVRTVPGHPAGSPGLESAALGDLDNDHDLDVLVGQSGVLVGTAGRDVLSGRGGDDCLFGRSGADRMSGGSGKDVLSGAGGDDRMNGDAGSDKVNGGNGNDTITPGAGKDKVAANGGDDTISARDGTKDAIDCGAGHDKATVDRSDSVRHCEIVKRAKRARRRH